MRDEELRRELREHAAEVLALDDLRVALAAAEVRAARPVS
jgi:hypothetical protein